VQSTRSFNSGAIVGRKIIIIIIIVFPYLIGTHKASGHFLLAQKQNWAG
jgi:hypothetical protein